MILEKGDMMNMWGKTSLFLVTTNAVIKKNGALVMGAGLAKTVRDRFPGIDVQFADLTRHAFAGSVYPGDRDGQMFGAFRVKNHFMESARIPIIMNSTASLMQTAHKYERVDLNFPGIGNGKLQREEVLPIISYLPDNVHVWEFGEQI